MQTLIAIGDIVRGGWDTTDKGRRAMKVVHIIKATGLAGAERHLLFLLAGLRRTGVDASLIVLTEPSNRAEEFVDQSRERGIPTERITIHAHYDLTVSFHLCGQLLAVKPDIVHTHLFHADLYGLLAARWARVPNVVTTRHNDNRFRRHWWSRSIQRLLWLKTQGGIAVSDYLNRFAQEVEKAPEKLIRTVHHGIEIDPMTADPVQLVKLREAKRAELGYDLEEPVVAIVCRLTEQKGVVYGLRAFMEVAEAVPGAKLAVIGDGPDRQGLESDLEKAVADGRLAPGAVSWLGWRPDASQLLPAFDLLLVPSLFEGFGLVLLEAMAARLPIVATNVSAIPEVVVTGKTGLLVPPGDAAALAGAVGSLLSNRGLRATMGEAGRQRLMNLFSLEQMISKTRAVYEALVTPAEQGSAPPRQSEKRDSGAIRS